MIILLLFGTRRLFVLKAPQSTAEKKDNFTFVLHIFGDSTGEIVFIYRRVFYWSYFLAPLTKKKSYFRRQSFVSRTRRLFVLKAPRKTVKRNDNFTSFWHSLVIWPVKWSSFKEEYFTGVIFLRRLQKVVFQKTKFCVSHASAFCFESAAKYSEKKMIISLLFCTGWWFDRWNSLHLKKSILLKLFSCVAYKKKSYLRRQSFVSRTRRLFVLKAPQSTVKKKMIISLLFGTGWWFDRWNSLHLKKSILLKLFSCVANKKVLS